MDLTVNLAPSYRDLKDPTTRQNFEDTVEQKRVIDLIPCHIIDRAKDQKKLYLLLSAHYHQLWHRPTKRK